MKRLVFMGSDPIALPLLDFLEGHQKTGNFTLWGIFSQPDRPTGRNQRVQPNPISKWALKHNIPLLRPQKPSQIELDWLKENRIDLGLVMAYGHILKKTFLDAPALGMLNFHASLLPAYRGAAPIEAAIANGETQTGVTLMAMVKKMDAGAMLDQETVPITINDTQETVRAKLAGACIPLIQRQLPALFAQKVVFKHQEEALATYTRKITKQDGQLNFATSATALVNRIRALTPKPGAFFYYQNQPIKVEETYAELTACLEHPGTVLQGPQKALSIATAAGILHITKLQRPGRKMIGVQEFLRGFPIPAGTILESQPMESLIVKTGS